MADPRIFLAVHEGWLHRLKDLVAEISPADLQKTMASRFTRITPLLAAVRRCAMQQNSNSCDVVEFLVTECGADVEQTGSVMFLDGDEIHDAPPLWIAAAVGCQRCVRLLVEAGANVNATTSTNSTPLRAACFDGHLEIVQYLVEHGADMEIANQHGHTCLMISCYKKHLPVAAYLLDRGAQVNRQSVKGNTAMHDAAEASHMEILKLLVRNGATFLRDCYNLTPLMTAALTGNRIMVRFLKDVFQVSPEEEADALKLLGATYVDKFNDLTAAYTTWRAALETAGRVEDQAAYRARLLQPSKEVSAAYGEGAREIATEADLEELYCDLEKSRMQSLILRERILGIAHPETFYFMRFRGAAYADRREYLRTLALWMYVLERQTTTGKPFSDMTHSLYLSILEIFNLMAKLEETLVAAASAAITFSSATSPANDPANSVLQTYDVFRVLKMALRELLHPQNDFLFRPKDCDNDNNNNNDDDNDGDVEVDSCDDNSSPPHSSSSSSNSSSSSSGSRTTKKYCTRLTRKLPALRGRLRGEQGAGDREEDREMREEEDYHLAGGEVSPRDGHQLHRVPLNATNTFTFNTTSPANVLANSVLQTYDVFRVLKMALRELLHPQNDFLFRPKDCDNDNNNNDDDNNDDDVEVDSCDDNSSPPHSSSSSSSSSNSSSSSSGSRTTKKYCTRLTRKLPALRGRLRGEQGAGDREEDREMREEEDYHLAGGEVSPRDGHQLHRVPLNATNTFNTEEGGNIIDRHFLLIIQLIGLLVRLRPQMSPAEWRCFQQVLYEFVSLEPRSATSYTLLHILTFITPADLPAPTLPIAPLGDLFEVVAAVSRRLDVIDLEGNTALHLLFRQMGEQQQKEAKKQKLLLLKNKEDEKDKEDKEEEGEGDNTDNHAPPSLGPALSGTLQLRRNMAEQLLARGAHLDLVNEAGRSPLDYVEAASLGNHFKVNCLSLACRAAAVIVSARLPLDGLPDDARAFVQRHQPKGFSANVYEEEEEEVEEGGDGTAENLEGQELLN